MEKRAGYQDSTNRKLIILLFVLIMLMLGTFVTNSLVNIERDTVTITVVDKETVRLRYAGSYGLIHCKDQEGNFKDYEVRDSWVDGVNRKDLMNVLRVDGTYKLEVKGTVIPIINPRQDIVKVLEVIED
jgi:hypothetical protein